jgi:hypothetical protein
MFGKKEEKILTDVAIKKTVSYVVNDLFSDKKEFFHSSLVKPRNVHLAKYKDTQKSLCERIKFIENCLKNNFTTILFETVANNKFPAIFLKEQSFLLNNAFYDVVSKVNKSFGSSVVQYDVGFEKRCNDNSMPNVKQNITLFFMRPRWEKELSCLIGHLTMLNESIFTDSFGRLETSVFLGVFVFSEMKKNNWSLLTATSTDVNKLHLYCNNLSRIIIYIFDKIKDIVPEIKVITMEEMECTIRFLLKMCKAYSVNYPNDSGREILLDMFDTLEKHHQTKKDRVSLTENNWFYETRKTFRSISVKSNLAQNNSRIKVFNIPSSSKNTM